MSVPRSAQLLLSKALTRALSVQALKPSAGTRAGAVAGSGKKGGAAAIKAPPASPSSSPPPSSAQQLQAGQQGKQQQQQQDGGRDGFSKIFF